MRRSIDGFPRSPSITHTRSTGLGLLVLWSTVVVHLPARVCEAQTLQQIPRPLVSQPKLAMQRAQEARVQWRNGQLEQALRTVNAALGQEPLDLTLRFMRGSLLFETEQYDAARTQFESLAEQFPELAEVQNNLASLHARDGRLEDARLALERAIQAQPRYALAWENLASVLARQASEALARSIELSEPAQRGRLQGKLELSRELSTKLARP